jgi:hypothetical protein
MNAWGEVRSGFDPLQPFSASCTKVCSAPIPVVLGTKVSTRKQTSLNYGAPRDHLIEAKKRAEDHGCHYRKGEQHKDEDEQPSEATATARSHPQPTFIV